MADVAEQTTPETAVVPEPAKDDFKGSPAYQAMSKQLADLQREKTARADAEKEAKRAAEDKALRDAGRFEELDAKYKKEIADREAAYARDILSRDLTNSLLRKGFENDLFVKGAIAGYNAEEHGDITAYTEALAADESNKGFLATAEGRQVHNAPGKTPTPTNYGEARGEKLKALAASEDPEQRKLARKIKADYFDKHGTLDGI